VSYHKKQTIFGLLLYVRLFEQQKEFSERKSPFYGEETNFIDSYIANTSNTSISFHLKYYLHKLFNKLTPSLLIKCRHLKKCHLFFVSFIHSYIKLISLLYFYYFSHFRKCCNESKNNLKTHSTFQKFYQILFKKTNFFNNY
jgi:hypothetical protein